MTICPLASWKPVGNHGGGMSAHLGLVLHVQEGNNGLSGWFNNPASGASSTFWVSKAGLIEQYVDADVCAWAQGDGNSTFNSVETEGYHYEGLTAMQEQSLAALYRWGMETYRWPCQLSESPTTSGFGWHGMGSPAWGNHSACPGDLRKNRRQAILVMADGEPPTGGAMAICSTPSGKGYWICGSDGGIFTYGDAEFHGSLGNIALEAPITAMAATPSGHGYWLLGADGGVFTFGDAPFYGAPTGLVQ